MAGQPGFFDWDRRHATLSAAGDPLERLALVIDFELFRTELEAALARSDRARGGRPPYDAVLMFKVLVLQTLYTLSDDQTEYQIRDRLSFMRFLGLALEDRVPDAKTVWLFREQLTRAGAVERLFERFDAALRAAGYLAMAGQIVVVARARPMVRTQAPPRMISGPRLPRVRRASGRSRALHPQEAGTQAVPRTSAARADRVCGAGGVSVCGSTALAKLGEDVTETLEVIPRRWKVVQLLLPE